MTAYRDRLNAGHYAPAERAQDDDEQSPAGKKPAKESPPKKAS